MPDYIYKAVNIIGEYEKGICTARDEKDLAIFLREKELYLLKYKKKLAISGFNNLSKLKLKEIAILCNQLSVILKAGINISDAMDILIKQSTNKRLKKSLKSIDASIGQGYELSKALAAQDRLFPRFMINMVEVGEYSGKLDYILNELSMYYSREEKIKNKVIKAIAYPIFVLVTTLCVLCFLITCIVPIFASTLESLGGKLPAITKLLLWLSGFLRNNSIAFLILAFISITLLIVIKKDKLLKKKIDKIKLELPIINKLYKSMIIIRFSKSMSILLSSGSSLVKSLYIVKDMFDNKLVQEMISECINDLNTGLGFGETIENMKIFTPLACSMIFIGEETGNLDEFLDKVCEIHTDEFFSLIDNASNFVEPIMIIIVSFIVGVVILSVVLPMMNIMDAIK